LFFIIFPKVDKKSLFVIQFSYFRHFEKKLHIAESKLEISCNIIDDFRHQYELSLDEIYDLQGEIDELRLMIFRQNQGFQ
jgi:hypothetical protein